ncbi:histidine phosphatase family protein [Romboutsia sp.]|uniref:histidine phosphatase family protein n=1 Tax=Romboutsia sp. TaxID=1965302 RepID=UPI003F2A3B3F
MTRLILVRHALTTDNQDNRLSGHIDSSVSKEGKIQIDKLTNYLKNIEIDKIFSTTSSRTKDTVKNIASVKNIEIIEKDTLKEINFGDFEGVTFEEIKNNNPEEFDKMVKEGYNYKYPGGESLIETYDRVAKEIDKIISENKDNNILVCSHGGTIRNIITHLISKSYEYHWNFRVDNASVSILEIQDGFTVINTMNNTSFI